MRINSSTGAVGIGTSSPLGKVHIYNSSVRTSVNGGSDNLVIEENGYSGLTILSNNANAGQIHFGDQDNYNIGMIQYFHSDNSMRFAANAALQRHTRTPRIAPLLLTTTAPVPLSHAQAPGALLRASRPRGLHTAIAADVPCGSTVPHGRLRRHTGGCVAARRCRVRRSATLPLSAGERP